jgi:hypothetical protein
LSSCTIGSFSRRAQLREWLSKHLLSPRDAWDGSDQAAHNGILCSNWSLHFWADIWVVSVREIGLHMWLFLITGAELISLRISQICNRLLFIYHKYFQQQIVKSFIFWDITPCSQLNVNGRFGGIRRLHLQKSKNNPSILPRWRLGAKYSSETSVDFQQTTRSYIPEDTTLHNDLCQNLKPHNKSVKSSEYCVVNCGILSVMHPFCVSKCE